MCCFLSEALSRLYIAPEVVSQMKKVRKIELTVKGVGQEIGRHKPGVLASCPEYINTYSVFRKLHMQMAIVNVFTMACSTIHLLYLSQSIKFVWAHHSHRLNYFFTLTVRPTWLSRTEYMLEVWRLLSFHYV